jgi:phenylalanine ammonia-lyase
MVTISGEGLAIGDIAAVARGAPVAITADAAVRARVEASRRRMAEAVARGRQVYGVTTLYGGMADTAVPADRLAELQRVALWHHKSATGPRLAAADVRAAMLLRANSLLKGVSGVRLELVERFVTFLNAGATPHVFARGSIGASGDLAPLSYIGGALVGLDPAFLVDLGGETLDAHAALRRLGLAPLALQPKEGLALNNGTAVSTGVAANCVERAFELTALAFGAHALCFQALLATTQSFAPLVHASKPHPGQRWAAGEMRALLDGSSLLRERVAGTWAPGKGILIQDRYSLRCLPQYVGPIVDGLAGLAAQIEVEANSASDNPLVDPDTGEIFHTGNFLAEYTAVAMDRLRYHLGMLASHLDAQLALLVAPEFSAGLAPSLVGNTEAGLNVGLKSLQIACNALAPLVGFYGHAMADRYPTHAEQFNQNVNSQAMNAANLARESLDVLAHLVAAALVMGVQAVELRAALVTGSYDASAVLSPATRELYGAVRRAAGGAPDPARPMVWDDLDGFLEPRVEGVLSDIGGEGVVTGTMAGVRESLRRHRP